MVIPLFNCLSLTQAMFASLQATLPAGLEYEVIFVDDGSTDGTRDWLAGLTASTGAPAIQVLLNERNLGYAVGNNRGAATARGDFLALLNNDLVLQPGWLEPMLAAYRVLGARAGIIGNIQRDARTGEIDHTGIVINQNGKPVHDHEVPKSFLGNPVRVRRVPAVTGACLLVSRDLWRELGGFDEGYVNGAEDVDLCFRARARGRINAVALTSTVLHHISSSAGRKLRDEENSYRLVRRWRREFVLAADGPLREWSRNYFEKHLPDPRLANPVLARHAWFYALGLRRTPPPDAIAFIEERQAREFQRWESLFPAAQADSIGRRHDGDGLELLSEQCGTRACQSGTLER